MKFAWRDALTNWINFLGQTGEISIAVNKSEDDTADLVRKFFEKYKTENPRNGINFIVTDLDIPYTDPEFDGKIKAAALEKCTQPYCILLDCDERVVPSNRPAWKSAAKILETNYNIEAILIPVLDLIGDENHYKSEYCLGGKWYLHRNRPNITRGVVRNAYRDDGSIDITKSDTCELIYKESKSLVPFAPIIIMSLPHFITVGQIQGGEVPFVYHLGWLDKEQRLRQTQFWKPVWENRNNGKIDEEWTLEKLESIKKYYHVLPSWKNYY